MTSTMAPYVSPAAALPHAVKMAGAEINSELLVISNVLEMFVVDEDVRTAKNAVATITWHVGELGKAAMEVERKGKR